jgi:sortase A
VRIERIGGDFVLVDGTADDDLRKGPGIYDDVPFPGAPGTTAIAGHRTTYGAPFRRIDKLERGDEVVVEMPYGRFTYQVEETRIVAPTEVSVVERVGFDRLVLSACHPLYSAAKRIVVFARLVASQARGAARL